MCRETINLFDLTHATVDSLVYDTENDMSSWSIAGSQFHQRSLIPMPNADAILQKAIDRKGAIEGFGIIFSFQEPIASMEFAIPLKMTFDCDWTEITDNDDLLTLDSIPFDRTNFHQQSMTFHGKISFASPVCGSNSYFYEKMDCLLHFSGTGHYIRQGNLRWSFASTPIESYPLDGAWEVQFSHGRTSTVIYVQKHFFSCFGMNYRITIDQDHRPRFTWHGEYGQSIEQTSNQQILPGASGPGIGGALEWKTIAPGYERIVWKRLATNLDNCWKSIDILAGNFVYRKCNEHPHNDQFLGPSYQANTLWGNTFCQLYSVGLASYHFLEPDSDGNCQAYISYESPKTEAWPSLDNGDKVPSRVPFRNISWDPTTRIFKGNICWEQDYSTTWMNESKWSYEIVFDATFKFVVSGTCSRSGGESHRFGIDLIYINAALETSLRMSLASQSSGEYLDVVRQWRDNNASTGTLAMLGEVAMAVMGDRESMFDFNL